MVRTSSYRVWLGLRDSASIDSLSTYKGAGLPNEGDIIEMTRGDRDGVCARVTSIDPRAEHPIRAVETSCPESESESQSDLDDAKVDGVRPVRNGGTVQAGRYRGALPRKGAEIEVVCGLMTHRARVKSVQVRNAPDPLIEATELWSDAIE